MILGLIATLLNTKIIEMKHYHILCLMTFIEIVKGWNQITNHLADLNMTVWASFQYKDHLSRIVDSQD